MKHCEDCDVLNNIRRWLSMGAIIKATDINKPILKWIGENDIESNLTITIPHKGEDKNV